METTTQAAADAGFHLQATDGAARAGVLRLAHGEVRTPAFMPVGTCATVKGLTDRCIEETGADIILGNVYHLMLRPSAERVARLGGLRAFMNRRGPILTDSGGFQVMSLSGLTKITEQGALFASHLDGSKHMLSPERSVEVQHLLDSDVTMVLDQCVRLPAPDGEVQAAAERSMRWAERSKAAFSVRPGYQLFGIVQGGLSESLRRYSAEGLRAIGFDGYAVGGLAVGEGQEAMFATLDFTVPMLPVEKPRYLMGVGKPSDILGAVARGIDMFDCVLPSRSGRNGQAFTSRGPLNLRNARFAEDLSPLDPECACRTCTNHSRAYLHHLVRCGEMTAGVLLTLHNLSYYVALTRRLRAAIEAGTFAHTADLIKEQWQKGLAGELTAC